MASPLAWKASNSRKAVGEFDSRTFRLENTMIGPDDPVLYDLTSREISNILLIIFLCGLIAWRRYKYKYWDWFAITIALILSTVLPLIFLKP